MDKRVGTVELGKDGDLVVWDRDPMVLGAIPDKVVVNGEVLVDRKLPSATHEVYSVNLATLSGTCNAAGTATPNYAVTGATVHTQANDDGENVHCTRASSGDSPPPWV